MLLKAKDYRKMAWTSLKGNWSNAVVCFLLIGVILSACSALTMGAVTFVIQGPLVLGFTVLTMTVIRCQSSSINDAFAGFKDFVRAFLASLLISIFTFLWSLLFIIPGIIMSYAYRMTFFILADHPELSANEARKQSIEMMRGNKWRLFCLDFSFIGWLILCCLTFGILTFWVAPYMKTAEAAFYQSLLPAPAAAPAENSAAPAAAPTESSEAVAPAENDTQEPQA